jgi:hypothetical protein
MANRERRGGGRSTLVSSHALDLNQRTFRLIAQTLSARSWDLEERFEIECALFAAPKQRVPVRMPLVFLADRIYLHTPAKSPGWRLRTGSRRIRGACASVSKSNEYFRSRVHARPVDL